MALATQGLCLSLPISVRLSFRHTSLTILTHFTSLTSLTYFTNLTYLTSFTSLTSFTTFTSLASPGGLTPIILISNQLQGLCLSFLSFLCRSVRHTCLSIFTSLTCLTSLTSFANLTFLISPISLVYQSFLVALATLGLCLSLPPSPSPSVTPVTSQY